MKQLADAPRRVPLKLWLQLVFGQWLMQMGAVIVGVFSLVLAFLLPRGPQDPPIWLASFILTIGCFPLFAVAGLRAYRSLRLLRHGKHARGRLVAKKEVANSETSYTHYTFEFELPDGDKARALVVTDWDKKELEDEPTESLVYDPRDPKIATTLDHLPGSPAIDETGNLVARKPLVWLTLVLPTAAVVGIAILVVSG